MGRTAGKAVLTYVGVIACVILAGFLAQRFFGGGTVRSPHPAREAGSGGRGAGEEEVADTDSKSHPQRPDVSFAAVGDTMLGNAPELPADPGSYLDPVKGQLRGDVVFGNLEGTLTDIADSPKCDGAAPGECYAFRTPASYARYLAAAGFTVMNDANNHSLDYGEGGLEQTVAALHRVGIAQDGLPGEITTVKAGGEKVAFLGFAPYDYTASLLDLPAARALIRRAARRARIVVVAIHAGAEGSEAQHVTGAEETYLGEDRGNPQAFARMAVRAGADLVLGSGPHVLRGMEIYRGRLIAYSLGNFSGFHNFDTSGVLGASAVLHATLDPDGAFRSGRIASVRLVEAGQPVIDSTGEGAHLIAELSREDLGGGAVKIGAKGRILGSVGD
jgi:poly-gamma-glutamate capsule biosynthesis protein CapA/YwtB (metallophosphatase superfamily)